MIIRHAEKPAGQVNGVLVSQHFFALKLNKADVVSVLAALANASVTTDPTQFQLVSNGRPADIQDLVRGLGAISSNKTPLTARLPSGVLLISKPSNLHVPTWQMVSAGRARFGPAFGGPYQLNPGSLKSQR